MYQVQCIAYHSETGEEMVVYQALYGDYRFYVRPLAMFMEKVDRVKYPDAAQEYRFEEVDASALSAKDNPAVNKTDGAATAQAPILDKDKAAAQASGPASAVSEKTEDIKDDGEAVLDSDVIRFLDADTYEERLEILTGMKYKITSDMIDIMSTVIDIEVRSGDVSRRYEEFKNALLTRKHYEGVRLR